MLKKDLFHARMTHRGEIMLKVSLKAAQWYIKEMELNEGDHIKFFGKIYGTRNGFSFALAKMEPSNPAVVVNVEGINFYIESTDVWFFDDITLNVDFDEDLKEPVFNAVDVVK